jgi:hypothetical protein
VKQAVMAGLGCSIMPLIGVKNELNNGSLQIVPVKGLPIKSNWNLIWLKGKVFVATAYLDFIQTEKKELLGRLLNGLRIKIEVVQNKYALLLFCFCINLIYYLLNNKSLLSFIFDAYSVKKM